MILVTLIAIPAIAGLLAWLISPRSEHASRWICVLALSAGLIIIVSMWVGARSDADSAGESKTTTSTAPSLPLRAHDEGNSQFAIRNSQWLSELRAPWIPQIGVQFFLAADGLSLLLLALTFFLGIMGVLASWTGITHRVGFFHFNLMWLLAALAGVFTAMDLILFMFFWEMMLVPLYLIIGIWGHENRVYATIKFFVFTQAGSLLMLLAMLVLYFVHGSQTAVYTFDFTQLIGTKLSPQMAFWLMLAFFAAFAVKLPAFPLHTWLPDAHTEAPTAGSVYLASLVLKAGAYGFLRFLLPLFPQAASDFAPVAMTLAVIGIIYGAVTAFGQRDLKRLVAYTSVSHMGFVLLGVFAMNELALQGAVIVILAHGLSTGALFILVGALSDRIHTRDMSRMGGLWALAPKMGGVMTFFALASLGLPGLANFVGEFLVMLGAFRVNPYFGGVAAAGLIVSVIYSLWMFQKAFHGPKVEDWQMPDLTAREGVISGCLIAATLWIGLYPKPVLNLSQQSTRQIVRDVHESDQPRNAPRPGSGQASERGREDTAAQATPAPADPSAAEEVR